MGRTAFICVSSWRLSSPVTGTTALTVVSCVASRNKRAPTGCFNSCVYPTLHLILRLDAREERQLSTRKRRVAGRPWAGVRPARPVGSQELAPFVLGATTVRPVAHSPERLRRWATGPATLKGRKSTAQKFSPTLRPFVLGRAPRRPPSAFAARRGRRFRTESRYSLLT